MTKRSLTNVCTALPGPVTATFVPRTKSGSTNLPEGVVHLYRECEQPPDGEKRQSVPSISESDAMPDDGTTLGVLAVPQWMTPSDFLAFVAPAAEGLAHLRLIRSAHLDLLSYEL